ncbi:uncharacterized protein LODBEIA_P14600 [Lodderomyces beijingensis]|uniref:Uncharacterized protein n=1 Tax=Lodderomyces beijingensis TaxID=1775926 RepID=A0ABP0ZJC4_9ASCO
MERNNFAGILSPISANKTNQLVRAPSSSKSKHKKTKEVEEKKEDNRSKKNAPDLSPSKSQRAPLSPLRNPSLPKPSRPHNANDSDPLHQLQQKRIDLHEQYVTKQGHIKQMEQELKRERYELQELEVRIDEVNRQEIIYANQATPKANHPQNVYKLAALQTELDLRQLALTPKSPSSTRSSFAPPDPFFSPLKKQASLVFEECASVRKKASALFEHDAHLHNLVKQSNEKLDTLTKRTSQFFSEMFHDSKSVNTHDISFNLDSLGADVLYDECLEIDDEYDSTPEYDDE